MFSCERLLLQLVADADVEGLGATARRNLRCARSFVDRGDWSDWLSRLEFCRESIDILRQDIEVGSRRSGPCAIEQRCCLVL